MSAERREAVVSGSAIDCSRARQDSDALMLPLAAEERQTSSEPAGEACRWLGLVLSGFCCDLGSVSVRGDGGPEAFVCCRACACFGEHSRLQNHPAHAPPPKSLPVAQLHHRTIGTSYVTELIMAM